MDDDQRVFSDYTQLKEALRKAIIKIRDDAGLTQEDFAPRCKTNVRHYRRIERGEVSVTLPMLFRVATGAGLPVSELLQRAEHIHAHEQAERMLGERPDDAAGSEPDG